MPKQHEGKSCIRRVRNIVDLAALAGVSAGTVSRALSGSPLVKEATRTRIQALAMEHGFRPNPIARRLRARRGGTVAILVPEDETGRSALQDINFCLMLLAVLRALDERGCDVTLLRAKQGGGDWLERAVDSGAMEGLVMIGRAGDAEAVDRLSRRYSPLVVWGFVYPGHEHCAVGLDLICAADSMMGHLITMGARHIGVTGDAPDAALTALTNQCEQALVQSRGMAVLMNGEDHAKQRSPDRASDEAGKRYDAIIVANDHSSSMLAQSTGADRATSAVAVEVVADMTEGARALVDCLLARIAGEERASVAIPHEKRVDVA